MQIQFYRRMFNLQIFSSHLSLPPRMILQFVILHNHICKCNLNIDFLKTKCFVMHFLLALNNDHLFLLLLILRTKKVFFNSHTWKMISISALRSAPLRKIFDTIQKKVLFNGRCENMPL